MNVSQIATENYGSVTGTWKNLKGDLLIFTNGNCTVSA
ncbi:DUF6287 domain-containing protein [Lactococcus lactis]|uniref:DUF6287 domain-containing protein n=1 Tax=Lactococcus lactis TaxID=1358 RepID=A0AAP3Z3G0_9LACT|nr:DUF6287 domain-containing protein [Lactococcus lactis]MCB6852890.1 DUF6287 domain-containing protein [Lactococcus lactis]MDG4969995.1 DUF6287 domain-containing protein [Lactococcus lactis]MDG4977634.1 DUF6287 domain-containing protein [Lactococcus lactis]MDG5103853.1 DUF6287 domain-containing protein [Lactococcus lactis]MDU6580899.1 DUF6287 domain-containing protein [Lactococcus lactis]